VAGRLDTIAVSQAILRIEVTPGVFVTAAWEGTTAIETLGGVLNDDVVVEGQGVFRPSGSLLRVDADALGRARPVDDAFRLVPSATLLSDVGRTLRLTRGERSPAGAIIGRIPVEESDESFAAAVDALS
jgi:hypothetical protein